jgi:superfamily I DNA/RNA helicase
MGLLEELNSEQRRAVEGGDGPVLVVAGPGTGKTKTLAARIAYLLQSGTAPEDILALTFTKKAAEEMRSRVGELSPGKSLPTITTFHGLCYELLGGNLSFVEESQRFQIIKSLPRPTSLKHLSVRELALVISRAKNSLSISDPALERVVQSYNQALAELSLNDFDDLLQKAHILLQQEKKPQRFRYMFVDEFQDTNQLQYELLRLLRSNDNIFVIGDPKQSIYGFRGASGDIFETFRTNFPKCQEITLHVNYRSTAAIVSLANGIFADTANLVPHSDEPGQVRAVMTLNEYTETSWVLDVIQRAIGGGDFLHAVSDDDRTAHRRLNDFAILYRSRTAVTALQKVIDESGLPYQVVGDGSPYEQPRVQEIIAIMRACLDQSEPNLKGLSKTQTSTLIEKLDATQTPANLLKQIMQVFGFEADRNVTQLTNLLVRFDSLEPAIKYLDDIAEGHFYDPKADAITLLTIHAAKGLEFPHVFLVACEEGLLPHAKAELEEERRLFYVAVTRARENLDILYTKFRGGQATTISRFIAELADDVLPKTVDPRLQDDERRAKKRKAKRSQQSLFD